MSYELEDFKTEEYSIIENGEYEATLDKIDVKTSKNGNKYATLTYRIRDDVEQKFQKRILFDNLFKEKDANGNATEYYNRKRLTKIIKAIFPENTPLNFNTIDDIFDEIVDHKLIIVVNHSHDDYYDKEKNYISYFKPTKHGDKKLDESDVTDEQVPF